LVHFVGDGKINLLAEQFLFPMPAHVRQALIDGYYGLDDAFVKEMLGKKLTSAVRKNLDETSEEIGIPVVSCRRQVSPLIFLTLPGLDLTPPAPSLITSRESSRLLRSLRARLWTRYENSSCSPKTSQC